MNDLFGTVATLPFAIPDQEGYAATWNAEWRGYDIVIPNGQIFYAEHFFGAKVSDRSVEYFQENDRFDWRETRWRDVSPADIEHTSFTNIKWKQDFIKFFGDTLPLPRLTSWYGDSGRAYTYSGISSTPNSWNDGLKYLKEQVELCAGLNFNSVLLNWYRDGSDHLSWHADDEKELGRNPVIASANFGETRDFVIRRNEDHATKMNFPLKHGTLLLMKGEMQHFWQHSVPKRKGVKGSRFNLTFRRIGMAS